MAIDYRRFLKEHEEACSGCKAIAPQHCHEGQRLEDLQAREEDKRRTAVALATAMAAEEAQ